MTVPGLLVGTWPPRHCGIAAYNEQMRISEGWACFDASPERPLSFRFPEFLRALGEHRAVRISFDPYALACGSIQALWMYPLLIALQATRRFEIVLHEPWKGRAYSLGLANALYRAFCRRSTWLVHVPSQSSALTEEFGEGLRFETLSHGGHFRRAYHGSRDQARAELGLPDAETWLCIGFVTAAKGFSGFAAAFLPAARDKSCLHVVGSVRSPVPADLDEASRLHRQAEGSAGGMEFHEQFVDDVSFDRWIAASDVVVLPYRETSTSGVVERARLFGKPMLVRDLPGLTEAVADDPFAVAYTDDAIPEAIERIRAILARVVP